MNFHDAGEPMAYVCTKIYNLVKEFAQGAKQRLRTSCILLLTVNFKRILDTIISKDYQMNLASSTTLPP